MTFHCFFEQSGTFKNEFKKLGYEAYDYDILNDFGETDYVIDLFAEIEKAYEGGESVFDSIKEEDQIIAFFPCVRFEDQIIISFRGENDGMISWTDEQKLEYDLKLHSELHHLYSLITKLVLVCIRREIPLIIENPKGPAMHYLNRYWCLKPSIVDQDRRERGDWCAKPTQYWFINRKPSNNLFFDPIPQNFIGLKDANVSMKKKYYSHTKAKNRQAARSMIHPDYANRFIREFII